MAVYPPQRLTTEQQTQICQIATQIGQAVHCLGMMNIQLVVADQIYVIDVNPRASRTVPFMSKNTGLPLAQLATQLILGKSLAALSLPTGLLPAKAGVAVKAPVFSFNKLPGTQMVLSPEMKSTGETMGQGPTFKTALNKALQDSYQLQNWQVATGIITDEASFTEELAAILKQRQIPVTIWPQSNVQLAKLTAHRPLIFTTDEQDQSLLTWGLSHALPVITAHDTLLACLTTQAVPTTLTIK